MVLILVLTGGIGAVLGFVLAMLFGVGSLFAVLTAVIAGTAGIAIAAAWLAIASKRREASRAKEDTPISQQSHNSESQPQSARSDLAASS